MKNVSSSRFCQSSSNGVFSQAGLGKLTILIFGSIAAVVIYCAYHIMPFYYYYYELQNQMLSLTRVASTHTDGEIRDKLMYHIRKMELPIGPDELRISREGQRIRMSVKYQEVFYVTFRGEEYDIHTFPFEVYVDEEF